MDNNADRQALLLDMLRSRRTHELLFNLCGLLTNDPPVPMNDAFKRDIAGKALMIVSNFLLEDDPSSEKISSAIRDVGLALRDLNQKNRSNGILQVALDARHPPKPTSIEIETALLMAVLDAASIPNDRSRGESAIARLLLQELGPDAIEVLKESRDQDSPTKEPSRYLTKLLARYRKGEIMDQAALSLFADWRNEHEAKFKDTNLSECIALVKAAAKDARERLLLLAS